MSHRYHLFTHPFHRPSSNHVINQLFPSHTDPDLGALFPPDFEFDLFGVIDKDSVAFGREVEGDVFVCLFRGGAAVCGGEGAR